jgi:hypothetical protein
MKPFSAAIPPQLMPAFWQLVAARYSRDDARAPLSTVVGNVAVEMGAVLHELSGAGMIGPRTALRFGADGSLQVTVKG